MQDLDRLRALADPDRADRSAARHKTGRETLGVSPADLEALVADWRATRDLDARLALARTLWDSDIHEARLAAARLLMQARIRPDDEAWQALLDWAPQIDGVEIGDAVMSAAARRLTARPDRIDDVASWALARNPWLRRGVLTATLPWAKMNNPKPGDLDIRDRILDLALDLSADRHGAVRQAAQGWLRDLSRHDPERARTWHEERDRRMAEGAPDPAPQPDAASGDLDADLDTIPDADPDAVSGDAGDAPGHDR